ncbi:MAG: tetratricopeptide repeat protein [Rhodocyclales bacterium]|nr:tetratricopeptide repeat protein [Rhodocyclales bacterium]
MMASMAARFDAALQAHRAGNLAQAESLYRDILRQQPTQFDCWQLLGALLVQAGRYGEALPCLDRALALNAGFASAWHNRALAQQNLGKLAAAQADFAQALALQPDYLDAHFGLGNLCVQQGDYAAAVACFDQALALNPAQADVHFNRGNALRELAQYEAALASYQQALALRPDCARFYGNQGICLLALGQRDAAQASFERAIALGPEDAEAHYNLGLLYFKEKAYPAALACFDQALRLRPDYADALLNRSNGQKALKDYAGALASCDQLIALCPDLAPAHSNRGLVLAALNQHEAAIASYDQALRLQPAYAEACYNRANAWLALHQYPAAIAGYTQAIALNENCAEFYGNRGIAEFESGAYAAAMISYERALALQPDYVNAQWNKALTCLLQGDFEQGWPLYEARWRKESVNALSRDDLPATFWRGETALAGKRILIHGEQGFGDVLQFCRYVPLLAALGARVTLETQKPLLEVLRSLPGVAELVEKGQALPAQDCHCPLLSLPLAMQTKLENIPSQTPYLFSDPQKRATWSASLGPQLRPRIGLVWSGNPTHKNDHNRSLTLAQLMPWLPAGCDYISLQRDVRDADLATLATAGIRHFGEELKDFSDTAALCDLMDLVISVDTSVAHLAGALGKPTWVLLPYVPDWRWLLDRDDSPWYPNMRLFRQPQAGDWDSVFARLGQALRSQFPSNQANDALCRQALALHQQGRFGEAEGLYCQLLAADPGHADGLHLLGLIHQGRGAHQEAEGLIAEAIRRNPQAGIFHSNYGTVLKSLGRLPEALASYDEALKRNANDVDALMNRGLALLELGRLEESLQSTGQALALRPSYVEAYNTQGNALFELQRYDEALASYDQAIALKSDYAEAYSNRGNALTELKQFESALVSYAQAIALKPDYAEAYYNRANACLGGEQFDSALAGYDQAIELKPDYAEAYYNRGVALNELKQFDSALASYDQAIALKPDYASAYWNKSLVCLLTGNFSLGWSLYEWRWNWEEFVANNARPDLVSPRWLGVEALAGKKILLHSEQGLGDTLQFVRYVDQVLALGADVLLEVPKPLLELFKPFSGRVRLLAKGEALPAHDIHCPLLSLPLAFKTRLDTIPKANAYLPSDPEKRDSWATRLGEKTGPRIGLAWSGNPHHKNDHNRSLLLSELLPGLPSGCEYISLQKEVREADKVALGASGIRYFGDELKDFADTAALCDLMDVVISVDTSVAHLAGALGKPTWILLPYVPDWRWLLDREDSPWYPTARLYRQPAIGDWASVLARVHDDLLRLAGESAVLV